MQPCVCVSYGCSSLSGHKRQNDEEGSKGGVKTRLPGVECTRGQRQLELWSSSELLGNKEKEDTKGAEK